MARDRIIQVRMDEKEFHLMQKVRKACDRPSDADCLRHCMKLVARQVLESHPQHRKVNS